MQIDVRLLPAYGAGGLKGAVPNIYKMLADYGYDLVIEKAPSIYDMVEVMIRVNNDPHVSGDAKRQVVKKLSDLIKTRDKAREALLARRLNELDQLLYDLENLFGELDENLR